MDGRYQNGTQSDSRKLAEHLANHGQFLLPMMDLVLESKAALDELLDDGGRAAVKALLLVSGIPVTR